MSWADRYREQQHAWQRRARVLRENGHTKQSEEAQACAEVYRKLAQAEQERLDKEREGC